MSKFFLYAVMVTIFSVGSSWVRMFSSPASFSSGSAWSSNTGGWSSGGGGHK